MASYIHGEEAAELYEGISAPMNARGIVTQGSVSQQLLGQQRAGNPVHGVAVPPIFSMYHQLPEELRRSFGVAEGFDLDGKLTELCLLQERLRDCILAALDANVIDCIEAWCGSCGGERHSERKAYSHVGCVPRRADVSLSHHAGNACYSHVMHLLKEACPAVLNRQCRCVCTNVEKVADHLEAVMGAALLLSGTRFKSKTPHEWSLKWNLTLGDDRRVDAGIRCMSLVAAVCALNSRLPMDVASRWKDSPMFILELGLAPRELAWGTWVQWRRSKRTMSKKRTGESLMRDKLKSKAKRQRRKPDIPEGQTVHIGD